MVWASIAQVLARRCILRRTGSLFSPVILAILHANQTGLDSTYSILAPWEGQFADSDKTVIRVEILSNAILPSVHKLFWQ